MKRISRSLAGLACLAVGAAAPAPRPLQAATIGDPAAPHVKAAEEHYRSGEYAEALEQYRQALVEAPHRPELRYNEGSALYKLGQFQPSLEAFEETAEAQDDAVAARSLYNAGNARFQLQDYSGAAEAYTRALERDPEDGDIRANLELALRRQQEQSQQNQQSGGQKGDKGEEQQQEGNSGQPPPQGDQKEQGEQRQPPSNSEQEEQDQSPSSQDEGDRQPAPKQQPPESQQEPAQAQDGQEGMTEAEAEQLMDALADHDQEAQRRRFRVASPASQEKDW